MTLGELLASYLEEECRVYDRAKGGEQPGTKRNAKGDRLAVERIIRHLSPNGSAAAIDTEALLGLAKAREEEKAAAWTRRNDLAFLRRVFSWAKSRPRRTGITRSPFAHLEKSERKRLLPKGEKRGYCYSPEELRAMYDKLPAYNARFVRFAVHTGMRLREITTLTWGNVDLATGVAIVEGRYAKNKKEREVALGAVAVSILEPLRPANAKPEEHIFIGRRGKPIRSVATSFDAVVREVCSAAKRKPRFHDLRKTGATRVEAVSSHAVAKAFLGHSDEDVTDSYLLASIDDVRAAVNRAARGIDGEKPAGVIEFPVSNGTQAGTVTIPTTASGQ